MTWTGTTILVVHSLVLAGQQALPSVGIFDTGVSSPAPLSGQAIAGKAGWTELPDFFADDIAVDATELPVDRAELPSENFLLHMVGRGEAIVLAVWNQRGEDVQVMLAGQGKARAIQASEIPYGTKGSICVALLESPGIWHSHDVSQADADRVIPLEWKCLMLPSGAWIGGRTMA